MSHCSSSVESECSRSSLSNSDLFDCSSVDGSVSLPRRGAACLNHTGYGSRWFVCESDSLWQSEYAKDILSYLRRIEDCRQSITYKSPQVYYRPELIALIRRVGEGEQLSRTTIHLAVYMLDVFMDTYKIVTSKLNLVAFVCILVAAKVEERDQNIPKICTLNSYTDNQYSRTDYKTLERMLLNFFKWSLLLPTSATFIESLVSEAVTAEELRDPNCDILTEEEDSLLYSSESRVRNISEKCRNLVLDFLELTLNERRLVHVKPSCLAAACIAAARSACGMKFIWSDRLQALTRYSYGAIEEHVEALLFLRDYDSRKTIEQIKKTPDSGCLTDSESDSQDDDDYDCPVPLKRKRLTY